MKLCTLLFVCATVTLCGTESPVATAAVPSYVAAAVADSSRPTEDRSQDENRKPEQVLAFAEVRPGETIVDLMPGSGYFTRLFSKVVGPKGQVYALQLAEMDKVAPGGLKALHTFAGTEAYPNVTVLVQPTATLALPQGVDLVWTSMNYHDLHDSFMGSPDMSRFNKAVFEALKPGGIYLVLDHAAASGTGFAKTDDLHRVDPAAVKAEVVAAGFEFVGESEALGNPADDHSAPVFDKTLRGKTDKFVYKFRKPLKPMNSMQSMDSMKPMDSMH